MGALALGIIFRKNISKFLGIGEKAAKTIAKEGSSAGGAGGAKLAETVAPAAKETIEAINRSLNEVQGKIDKLIDTCFSSTATKTEIEAARNELKSLTSQRLELAHQKGFDVIAKETDQSFNTAVQKLGTNHTELKGLSGDAYTRMRGEIKQLHDEITAIINQENSICNDEMLRLNSLGEFEATVALGKRTGQLNKHRNALEAYGLV